MVFISEGKHIFEAERVKIISVNIPSGGLRIAHVQEGLHGYHERKIKPFLNTLPTTKKPVDKESIEKSFNH